MPIAEITSALTGLKATLDFVKGANAAIDRAKLADQLSDVLGKLISAQSQTLTMQGDNSALITEKGELTKKLEQLENWTNTERDHELHQPGPGVFVYVRKDSDNTPKKFPWFCTNCWENKIKSILQCEHDWANHASYSCPRCKTKIAWDNPNYKEPEPPQPIW